MSKERVNHDIKVEWQAQNDAQFASGEALMAIARYLARRAAERDFEAQQEAQERKDAHEE